MIIFVCVYKAGQIFAEWNLLRMMQGDVGEGKRNVFNSEHEPERANKQREKLASLMHDQGRTWSLRASLSFDVLYSLFSHYLH